MVKGKIIFGGMLGEDSVKRTKLGWTVSGPQELWRICALTCSTTNPAPV